MPVTVWKRPTPEIRHLSGFGIRDSGFGVRTSGFGIRVLGLDPRGVGSVAEALVGHGQEAARERHPHPHLD